MKDTLPCCFPFQFVVATHQVPCCTPPASVLKTTPCSLCCVARSQRISYTSIYILLTVIYIDIIYYLIGLSWFHMISYDIILVLNIILVSLLS